MSDDLRTQTEVALQNANESLKRAERLISVRIAGKRLQRCPATIRHWIKTGKLGAVKYPSGQFLVKSESVEKILQQDVQVSESL